MALVSQEWEEIYVFENDGHAAFKPGMIYGSTNEDFGSSGISLVDMDLDGDLDVLYTNGDAFDYIPARACALGMGFSGSKTKEVWRSNTVASEISPALTPPRRLTLTAMVTWTLRWLVVSTTGTVLKPNP